jgi:hypothetical protein
MLVAALAPACVAAQGVHTPPVKPTDHPEILFAAQAPDSEKDDSGKPTLAAFEPIAFVAGVNCESATRMGHRKNRMR